MSPSHTVRSSSLYIVVIDRCNGHCHTDTFTRYDSVFSANTHTIHTCTSNTLSIYRHTCKRGTRNLSPPSLSLLSLPSLRPFSLPPPSLLPLLSICLFPLPLPSPTPLPSLSLPSPPSLSSLSPSLSPRPSNTLNPQPELHPVPAGTQSPSSASRTVAASSLVGWPPLPHLPVVDFVLHVVRSGVWTLMVVRRGSHCRYLPLPPWAALADGWIAGGLSSPPQDGCHQAKGRGMGEKLEAVEDLRSQKSKKTPNSRLSL